MFQSCLSKKKKLEEKVLNFELIQGFAGLVQNHYNYKAI